MTRRFEVFVHPEMEREVVEADTLFYSQESGWLCFKREGGVGHSAVFAPGKWVFFKEVTP